MLGIQVCLISWMNFDFEENGGMKSLLANLSHQYHVSQLGEHYCHANNKRIDIIMSIQFCLISRMNFGNKENGGRKAFLANPKHQYHVSQ